MVLSRLSFLSRFSARLSLGTKCFSMASIKPMVVFVLGGPGAGKGTQCANIVRVLAKTPKQTFITQIVGETNNLAHMTQFSQDFGFIHLSAGDLLRAARDSGSPDGKLIDDYIRNGKIVPVKITISLIQKSMESSPVKKFLIDGFPRNEDNLTGWEKQMGDVADVKFVLFFECPEETCLERVSKRGQSSGRADDNRDAFVKRYRTYLESTMPIIEKYSKKGLVKTVDGTKDPEEVFSYVKNIFSEL